jgi:hypothetical protein
MEYGKLHAVHLVDGMIRPKVLTARNYSERVGEGESVPETQCMLQDYEAECGTAAWLERSRELIVGRVAALESQLRAAPLEDHSELRDALQTFRTALSVVEQELAPSRRRAQRLVALREQASAQPRLRLVVSS